MSKKIIYVTGCAGFIGAYVTRALLSAGHFVYGVDKMTYAAREETLKELLE